MLLLSDPSVAATAIRECGEELVDLREARELVLDVRKQDDEGAWAHVRAGVRDRLLTAQASLPPEMRLLIIEGFRPAGLQQRYFVRHRDGLARAHPEWARERLDTEVSKHVAPRPRWAGTRVAARST